MTRALASALVLASVSAASAANLAINFGADEPNGAGSTVDGPAGLYGTGVWNNTTGASGSAANLLDGDGGASTASVTWNSPNTWASQGRGEDNNTAPAGEDRDLMTGYLDTGATPETGVTVTVSGLSSLPSLGDLYNVTVYMKGGVIGRGGDYTIGGETIQHVDTAPFDGTYEIGPEGDAIIFENVSGDSFTLTSVGTIGNPFRAPINAIEISPIPEPATIILAGVGLAAFALFRRRK